MLRQLIILLFGILCLCSSRLYASHAAGMDIKYEYIGPSGSDYEYRITIYFYRPCDPNSSSAPVSLPVYYRCGVGGVISSVTANDSSMIGQYTIIESPCPGPPNPCNSPYIAYQKYTYQTTITLSACSDWEIWTYLNARNAGITTGPSGTLCVKATMDNTIHRSSSLNLVRQNQ